MAITFCSPQVALVGPPCSALPDVTIIGEVDFAGARIAASNADILCLYVDPADGRLLGAEMCAPAAEHIAHLLTLAVERGLTVPQILTMPFYHPDLEAELRGAPAVSP